MRTRTLLLLMIAALVAGVLMIPGAALAESSGSSTLQAAALMTRGEFAELAVSGLGLSPAYATPTFSDVPASSPYYPYVQGAVNAGLTQGIQAGFFGVDQLVSRQQAATMLARYLAAKELGVLGYIAGADGAQYSSLSAWYAAEGEAQLSTFRDSAAISATHRVAVAYLAARGVLSDSGDWLSPRASMVNSQANSLISKVLEAAAGFSKAKVPTVVSVTPNSGTADGGTTVLIFGTGFSGATAVYFGQTPATSFAVTSANSMTAVVPAGAAGTTVGVRVETKTGTSADTAADDYTYEAVAAAPIVNAIYPSVGYAAGGTTVYIYGSNFTETSVVRFGSHTANYVKVVNSGEIIASAPSGTAGTVVGVSVTTQYGVSSDTTADDFYYYYDYLDSDAPAVTSLSPDEGDEGDEVIIRGTNFPDDVDDVAVYFGSERVDDDYIDLVSSTKMVVIVPEGDEGATVRVKVVTDDGTSPNTSADDFTYDDESPTVTSLSPDEGEEGDEIIIRGTNFPDDVDDVAVYFGTEEAEIVEIVSSTKMIVVVPEGDDGDTVRVKIVTDDGTSSNTSRDDFTYDD